MRDVPQRGRWRGARLPDRPVPFRSDIEGLRGLAVLLVVLDHLVGWPRGGFIGVDVFFVISGFLITSLLVAEAQSNGRVSLRGFYLRRVRRILPVAVVVLAATVVTARLAFRGARVTQAVHDVLWALGFSANIHFSRIGTDYFQADRAPSLVQHFWSLAVEEQFYLVWPCVVVLALAVPARSLGVNRSRTALLALAAVATAGSFALSLHDTSNNVVTAYFSSPARAWELDAGSVLAIGAPTIGRVVDRLGDLRAAIWIVGLAAIVASAFVVPSRPGFPAPWGGAPVLATVVLIAAGLAGPTGRCDLVLTNPVTRYLGRISYSLYLWHWPAIVAAAALVPAAAGYRYAIAVLAMIGLSVASYHFVEAPGRRLGLAGRPKVFTRRTLRPAGAVGLCAALVLTLAAFVPARSVVRFTTPTSITAELPHDADVSKAPASLATAITTALQATRFPQLTPPLSQQGTARAYWTGCTETTPDEAQQCRYGSTAAYAEVAVVIGDSMAMSWLPGIATALGPNWRVIGLTLEACPAADVRVYDENHRYDTGCNEHHTWATQEAVKLDPRLVVLSGAEDTLDRLADNATGQQATTEYERGLTRVIDQLRPSTNRSVVTLASPPRAGALSACDTAAGKPADCVRAISSSWLALSLADRQVARTTGTGYVDTRLWFCNQVGYCPAFIGTVAVRWDTDHITDVYARSLAPELRTALGQL